MTQSSFPGVYRGVVEDANDPELRKRYRVRVFMLHPEEVTTEALPWAESSLFGGKFFGDLPAFEAGDPVWVMFEGGNRRFPVIMGGSMSQSGGVPDAPTEVRAEYKRTQKRWVRLDRAGNKIVMSPLPDERYIQIEAGDASITLRQNGAVIEVASTGQVNVTAPVIVADAEKEVTVTTAKLFAQVEEEATIRSADVVNIQGSTKINIGRYEDPLLGAAVPVTTDEVDVRADSNIKVESSGTIDVDAQANITVDTQSSYLLQAETEVNIYGVNKAVVRSDGDVEVNSGANVKIDAVDNVEVTGGQKVIVDASAAEVEITAATGVTVIAQSGDVAVEAQAGNVTIDGAVNVDITASASGKFETTGPLELKSASSVTIEAPLVEMKGQAKATVDGGALAEIKGALVQIG